MPSPTEKKPPSQSWDDFLKAAREGIQKNRKDWETNKDMTGAGEQPVDDDHLDV